MRLPNPQRAEVSLEKLIEYCLNPYHSRGKHKARVFESACGYKADNAELLRQQLFIAAELGEAFPGKFDAHGQRWVVEYLVEGPAGAALVHSAWIVRGNEDFPRFLTAYVV